MREPRKYTVTDVADRFEQAAQTLHRLPRVGVQGYFNAMPEVIRTAAASRWDPGSPSASTTKRPSASRTIASAPEFTYQSTSPSSSRQ